MKKALTSLLMLLCIVGGSLALVASASATPAQKSQAILWRASLVPCNPGICGGYPQNTATLSLEKGNVTVAQSGLVMIRIHRLSILSSGEIAANKTLEVNMGSFTTAVYEGVVVGTITTDAQGNFSGTIDTGDGVPFAFASGTAVSTQCILNEPGVRSEFITGFSVP